MFPGTVQLKYLMAFVKMGRPLILPGGILAYTLGVAMAYAQQGSIHWRRAVIGLLITVVANLMAHYADEYADVDTDSLTRRTLFAGGSGVLPAGTVPPAWAKRTALIMAGLAVGLTVWFVATGTLTWHVLWIVGAGLLGGWVYSMPPLALERRGLGELDNALLGAVLMPLMGYTVQTGRPSLTAVVALVPIFCIVMVGLLGVHWADRRADKAVGKRSLVVLLGERTRQLHWSFAALAYVSALVLTGWILPRQVSVAILLTLPVSGWAVLTFTRQDSPAPSSLAMASVIAAASVGWVMAAG